jgi:hypothetical protein
LHKKSKTVKLTGEEEERLAELKSRRSELAVEHKDLLKRRDNLNFETEEGAKAAYLNTRHKRETQALRKQGAAAHFADSEENKALREYKQTLAEIVKLRLRLASLE